MLKKSLFFVVLALAAGGAVHAQTYQAGTEPANTYVNPVETDRTGRWDLGVNVSGAFSEESDDLDDTFFVGGNASYGVNPWLGIGVEGGWQQTEFDNDDLTAIPLFVNGIVRFPNEETPFVPYGSLGVGAIIWDIDDSGPIDDIDIDASFALKPAVGLDYFINSNWILNVEAAYVFTDEDIEVTSQSRQIDLSYWTVGAGLKFVF
jgi:opacity protein-like surface antigen